MRGFEVISFDTFKREVKDDLELYKSITLPKRATAKSAGYDIYSLYDFVIKPGCSLVVPTGLKVRMNDNEALLLMVRSSQGFKYNVRLCNQVGLIDSDYYDNTSNEGHFSIKLMNEGNIDYKVLKGDKICQGVFINYLVSDNDDNKVVRTGGFGSTDKI